MADKIYAVHRTDGYDVHDDVAYFYNNEEAEKCAAHARKQERAQWRKIGLGREYDYKIFVIEKSIFHTAGGWLKAQQEDTHADTSRD